MIVYPNTVRGQFLARPNRFLARVLLDGREVLCHVKNTGRCRELLVPGAEVWCQHHDDPKRRTAWSLITVRKGTRLVNLDSQVSNRLAAQWLAGGGLGAVADIRPEQRCGDARLDLRFCRGGRSCWMEVKGVTLEQDGVARFPDAPTERGVRHLEVLRRIAGTGDGAYALFVCQMDGIARVEPNWATHPAFGEALRRAEAAGVTLLALQCAVTADTIDVAGPVPVVL